MKLFALWTVAIVTVLTLSPAHTRAAAYTGSVLFPVTYFPPFFSASLSSGDGGQVVGSGDASFFNHAVLWSSGGGLDLHPTNLTGFSNSGAVATDGIRQAGYGSGSATGGDDVFHSHALLWSGTADSAVDLHPTNLNGFSFSTAYSISGTQQVGLIT